MKNSDQKNQSPASGCWIILPYTDQSIAFKSSICLKKSQIKKRNKQLNGSFLNCRR